MILSPEEHLALAKTDPEWEELVNNSPPIRSITADTDIHKLRDVIIRAAKEAAEKEALEGGEKPYIEEDHEIPVQDGSSITIRVHKPRSPPKDGCPIFVFYHGGGHCIGGLYSEMTLCRAFTQLGGITVNVDYRLAPEYPFPVGWDDAYDALKWTAAHVEELGGNTNKGFLVGGVSAGANLASVLSHRYRDDKLSPPLTGQYLSILPAGDENDCPDKYKHVYLSRKQNSHTPILNDESIAWFNGKVKFDYTSKIRSVLAYGDHHDLPPTYFQVCGADPLRDEGLIYEEILKEEYGTKTRLDVYPGLPHGFWIFFAKASFTKKFRADCIKGLEWLLSSSS